MSSLASQLDSIGRPRILVLGDLILDRYTFGSTDRVSPEAPVLVLRCDAQEVRLGGAASVAFLLRALGAEVVLAGVVGDDAAGRTLQKLVDDHEIDSHLVLTDPDRPTTIKERFVGRMPGQIARGGHQILRVDSETRDPIGRELEAALLSDLQDRLDSFAALLISDYAKGACTVGLLAGLIDATRRVGIPVLVDPARIHDYCRYRRSTLVKPNRIEAERATGCPIHSPQDALVVAGRLCRQFEFEAALVTLDRDGMALAQDDESRELFPTAPREICDVTGAGDMTLAMLGLCIASDLPLNVAVRIANVAAGLEVERLGVAPVTRAELRTALERVEAGTKGAASVVSGPLSVASGIQGRPASLATDHGQLTTDKSALGSASRLNIPHSELRTPNFASKLISLPALTKRAADYRLAGKTIVFTNGCFDLLHVGHVTALQEAAALGDVLIVAVNSDASVRRLKGAGRPIIGEQSRVAVLGALDCVDHVVLFDEATPLEPIAALRPDVLVKGGEYRPDDIAGREIVESHGGQVRVVGHVPGVSTTDIVRAIARSDRRPEAKCHGPPLAAPAR